MSLKTSKMHTCKSGKSKFSPGSMPPNPPYQSTFLDIGIYTNLCTALYASVYLFYTTPLLNVIWGTTFLSGLWMKDDARTRMNESFNLKLNTHPKQPKLPRMGKAGHGWQGRSLSRTGARQRQGQSGKARQGTARQRQGKPGKTQDRQGRRTGNIRWRTGTGLQRQGDYKGSKWGG